MKRQIQSLKQNEVICNQSPQPIKKPLSVDVIENKLREIEKRRNNNKPSSSINPTRRDVMPSKQQSKLKETLESMNGDSENEARTSNMFSSDQENLPPLTEATNEQSNPRKTVNRDMINREKQPTSSQYSPFTYWNNYIK